MFSLRIGRVAFSFARDLLAPLGRVANDLRDSSPLRQPLPLQSSFRLSRRSYRGTSLASGATSDLLEEQCLHYQRKSIGRLTLIAFHWSGG